MVAAVLTMAYLRWDLAPFLGKQTIAFHYRFAGSLYLEYRSGNYPGLVFLYFYKIYVMASEA
ncbi:hypothetical protein LC593_05340 [Nostoc sp. CHAB 5844]|nr:hypothetical protein [Nostoc sp. CHAB 5844]